MVRRGRQATIILLLILVFIQVFAVSAVAVDDFNKFDQTLDQQQTPAKATNTSIWFDVIKLVLILALIMGAAWSVVRFFGQKSAARMQGKWLQVVDEILLDHNRSIVLCKAGDVIYGLGVTDHNISLLFRLDNDNINQEIDKYLETAGILQGNTDSWKGMINSIFKPRQTHSPSKKEFHWLIEEQAKRLDNLSQVSVKDADRGGRSGDYE